jgi:hypothetical protein
VGFGVRTVAFFSNKVLYFAKCSGYMSPYAIAVMWPLLAHSVYANWRFGTFVFYARHAQVSLRPTVLITDTLNKVVVMENVSASERQTLCSVSYLQNKGPDKH